MTDILRDESGEIAAVEVSEKTAKTKMCRKAWLLPDVFDRFRGCDLYRYEKLEQVPYEPSLFVRLFGENHPPDDLRYDVLPDRGDKANYPLDPEENLAVDILTGGWVTLAVSGNGSERKIPLNGRERVFLPQDTPGHYTVQTIAQDGRIGPKSEFCVTDYSLSASAEGNGVRLYTRCSSGSTFWAQRGTVAESCFVRFNGDGDESIFPDTSLFSKRRVRVGIKNEFGTYVSEFVQF